MPIILKNDKDELRRGLRRVLKRDVTLRLFTQPSSLLAIPGRDCKSCPQTQELLEEFVSLSPKLHLLIHDYYTEVDEREKYNVERVPAIILGDYENAKMKYYGNPAGYEFVTILEAVKLLSRGVSPLGLAVRKSLRKVNQPVYIQVFVTPTGPQCPSVARLAHAVSMENTRITADVIEVSEYPNLARMYNVTTVPKTIINQLVQLSGVISEDQLTEKILEVGVKRPATTIGTNRRETDNIAT